MARAVPADKVRGTGCPPALILRDGGHMDAEVEVSNGDAFVLVLHERCCGRCRYSRGSRGYWLSLRFSPLPTVTDVWVAQRDVCEDENALLMKQKLREREVDSRGKMGSTFVSW